jgi:hypothetical protein
MSTPEEKLEALIKDFEKRTKTKTENPAEGLRELIKSSPELKDMLLAAVKQGELKKIEGLPAGTNAGGQYSGTTMQLPLDTLNKSRKDPAEAYELAYTIGHETRHGLYNPKERKALDEFEKSVEAIAKVKGGKHDYTEAVGKYVQHYRENEASANISGWNTLASMIKKEKPEATLQDMYDASPFRMGNFIDRTGDAPNYKYELKKGLSIDEKTMQMPMSQENIKASAKYYFDKPLSEGSLGKDGDQNYPNYYGNLALNRIQEWEKVYKEHFQKSDPKYKGADIQVDLAKLGLDKSVIDTDLKYRDISPRKPTTENESLRHDAGASPESRDPKLFRQAIESLQKAGPESLGISNRQELENVAAALALKAQKAGMTDIEGVTKGNQGLAIAYQANGQSGDIKRVDVNVAEAKTQNAAATLTELTQATPPKVEAPVQQKSQAVSH